MKKTIKILFIIILLNSYCSHSQVVTTISQVFVNSQNTITNCSLIDFGTTSNNNITVYYKLTKPLSQAVSGNITLQLKYSSSSNGNEKTSIPVQSISWVDNTQTNTSTFESTISCNISESEIQVTGSSIYAEFATSSNIKTSSCEYPLKKTPTPSFTFSSPNLSIACGDTNARTFTVTPANIPTGANVKYQWSYSGWSGTANSTMSSIVLTPSSAFSLPSNVTVNAYIDNVLKATKIYNISRVPFTTTGQINNYAICTVGSTNTYTLTGLASLSPTNTITWSTSNTSVATVTSSSNGTVLITAQSQGFFTLKATITNPCGEIVEITSSQINVAMPTAQPSVLGVTGEDHGYYSPAYISDLPHDQIGVNKPLELTSTTITGNTVPTDWEWQNVSGRFVFSGSNVNGNTANGKTQKISFINGDIPDKIEFKCRAKSSCNWSEWKTFVLSFSDGKPVVIPTTPPPPSKYFTVSPNPAHNTININLTYYFTPPSQMPPQVAVFSAYGGQAIIPKTSIQGGFTYGSLNISNLFNGYYILTIYWGSFTESHNFIKN